MGSKGARDAHRTLLALGCVDKTMSKQLLIEQIREAILAIRAIPAAGERGWTRFLWLEEREAGNKLFDAENLKRLTARHDELIVLWLCDKFPPIDGVLLRRRVAPLSNGVWKKLRLELGRGR